MTSNNGPLWDLTRLGQSVWLDYIRRGILDDGALATMIREHPRFQKVAMIFISAVQVEEVDRLRGYAIGAVDYVPVPVVPQEC